MLHQQGVDRLEVALFCLVDRGVVPGGTIEARQVARFPGIGHLAVRIGPVRPGPDQAQVHLFDRSGLGLDLRHIVVQLLGLGDDSLGELLGDCLLYTSDAADE